MTINLVDYGGATESTADGSMTVSGITTGANSNGKLVAMAIAIDDSFIGNPTIKWDPGGGTEETFLPYTSGWGTNYFYISHTGTYDWYGRIDFKYLDEPPTSATDSVSVSWSGGLSANSRSFSGLYIWSLDYSEQGTMDEYDEGVENWPDSSPIYSSTSNGTTTMIGLSGVVAWDYNGETGPDPIEIDFTDNERLKTENDWGNLGFGDDTSVVSGTNYLQWNYTPGTGGTQDILTVGVWLDEDIPVAFARFHGVRP